jgi:hypothetical protein
MRGTGPIAVAGITLYAYYTEAAGALRVRVSVDEWDRLGLCEGQRVRVVLPGREAAELLLTAALRTPPFVWLDLAPLAPRSVNRAG